MPYFDPKFAWKESLKPGCCLLWQGDEFAGYGSGMNDIGDWDNNMAQGMMPLEEEQAAFIDPTGLDGGNNHGHH